MEGVSRRLSPAYQGKRITGTKRTRKEAAAGRAPVRAARYHAAMRLTLLLATLIPAVVLAALPPLSRAADLPAGTVSPASAVVDSLVEAEKYDEAIALAEKEVTRLESRADAGKHAAGNSDSASDSAALLSLRSALMLAHFHKGELHEARAEQENVVRLRAASSPSEDVQLADDLNDLAMICDRLGDDDAAAASWRRSLSLLRASKPADVAAKFVPRASALAETERKLGLYDESERGLREAIEMSEKYLPRNQRHARLLNNLGALVWDENRFDEASRLLREALRVTEADSTSTPLRVAVAHHNLANLKREQGEREEAERLHLLALGIAREKLLDDPQYPIFLKELAVLYADERRFPEAFALWDEALAALGEKRGELLASEILHERGRAELDAGTFDAAGVSLRESLAIRRAKSSRDHPRLGQSLAALGALEERRGETKAARRDFEAAAAILAKTEVYPEERAEALSGVARLDWKDGRRDAAIAGMRRSLDGLEELRLFRSASEIARADWVRKSASDTQTMIGWLVKLERFDEAIGFIERIRGRILGDQMASAHVDWRRDLSPDRRAELDAKERAAKGRIQSARRALENALEEDDATNAAESRRSLEEKLDAAVREYRDTLEEARVQSAGWARALGEEPAAGLAQEARARLAADERILMYQIGERESFVFEIARGEPVQCMELRVPTDIAKAWDMEEGALTEKKLDEVILSGRGPAPRFETDEGEVRGVGSARPAGEVKPVEPGSAGDPARLAVRSRDLARLADILLPASIRARVLGAKRIHLFPDAILHDLPFEALVLAEANGSPVYWLDRGPALCYGHSIATLFEFAERSRSLGGGSIVLTVNDPGTGVTDEIQREKAPPTLANSVPTRRFHPLPGSRREGEAFARAFSQEKVVRLVGKDAREGAVKKDAPMARILHFGTHGIVDQDQSDLLAALVLANEPEGSPEDGFLHLFEVYEMGLKSDLVVLSACETKLGTRVRGEGVLALSRGFLAAGARRAVASLWPVHDEATAELMTEFFGALGRGEDAASALLRAKRLLRARADREDPFFWAPFVLSGAF